MSAFIVSTETMQRVIAAITDNGRIYDGMFAGEYLFRNSSDLDKLGNGLFAMNADAVNQRYSGENDIPPSFSYRPLGDGVSLEDRYQAVSCLIYQCSEGDVPERQIYRELCDVKKRLAYALAALAVGKAKSPWDWPEAELHV